MSEHVINEYQRQKDESVADYMRRICGWLDWQIQLSHGLRSLADAEKLWLYWTSHPELPEFADEDYDDNGVDLAAHRIKALGYDPMSVE